MEKTRAKWKHHPGDLYAPVFSLVVMHEGRYEFCWEQIAPRQSILKAAMTAGFTAQGSEDFNIAVLCKDRVVALLWMDENMDVEQSVLDKITSIIYR